MPSSLSAALSLGPDRAHSGTADTAESENGPTTSGDYDGFVCAPLLSVEFLLKFLTRFTPLSLILLGKCFQFAFAVRVALTTFPLVLSFDVGSVQY